MRFDVATLFPEMVDRYLSESVIGRARAKGVFEAHCHNIRDYTVDKHRRVDDTPYSERQGMLLQADPIWRCFEAVTENRPRSHVIFLSPQGKVLTQQRAKELAQMDNLFLLCGHYEGVDQRILDVLEVEELSVGDYVLTGGELPALVLIDCVVRMLDGALSGAVSYEDESHYSGLLEYPQYTRPEVWNGIRVPEILLSGHHANILKWRHEQSLLNTLHKRPDLIDMDSLSPQDKALLDKEK